MLTHASRTACRNKNRSYFWWLGLWGLLALVPLPARCQIIPSEVSLNYSYLRANSSGTGGSFNANGASASAAWKIRSRLSIVADFGGYHFGSQFQGVDGRLLTYTFGPRITLPEYRGRWIPFGQLLLGAGRVSGTVGSLTAAENGFVMLAGGGLNARFRERLTIRVIEINYLMTRFVRVTDTPGTQNDIRVSSGLIFHFGRK
jgi:outer membrane immunogenic protein